MECGVVEARDVMLSVIVIMNTPTAVGSSDLLDLVIMSCKDVTIESSAGTVITQLARPSNLTSSNLRLDRPVWNAIAHGH